MKKTIELPIIESDGDFWILLNFLQNRGILRAASISKVRHVPDSDGHHCEEVAVKSSIRYKPRIWDSLSA